MLLVTNPQLRKRRKIYWVAGSPCIMFPVWYKITNCDKIGKKVVYAEQHDWIR